MSALHVFGTEHESRVDVERTGTVGSNGPLPASCDLVLVRAWADGKTVMVGLDLPAARALATYVLGLCGSIERAGL